MGTRPVSLIFLFIWKPASKSFSREKQHQRNRSCVHLSFLCLTSHSLNFHPFIFLSFAHSYLCDICYILFHKNGPKSSVISRIYDSDLSLRRLLKYASISDKKLWVIDFIIFRDGSRTTVTSKMEFLAILVNGWKALTNVAKNSVLYAAVVLDTPPHQKKQATRGVQVFFKYAANLHENTQAEVRF